jgi:PilZ domain
LPPPPKDSTPPEAEILNAGSPTTVTARLGDLSRSGCFVETTYSAPLEAEVTLILKKSGDQVRARARVVRAFPNQGVGLEFLSIEGNGLQVLEDWLSTFVGSSWVAATRRRTQRVAMQIRVRVSGDNAKGARFAEETSTNEINSAGCSLKLRTPVGTGQRLVLHNLKTNISIECMVAYRSSDAIQPLVGLGFLVAADAFWPIVFTPTDWSIRQPVSETTRGKMS